MVSFIKSKTKEAHSDKDGRNLQGQTFRQSDIHRERERVEQARSASGGAKVAMIGSIELQMAAKEKAATAKIGLHPPSSPPLPVGVKQKGCEQLEVGSRQKTWTHRIRV